MFFSKEWLIILTPAIVFVVSRVGNDIGRIILRQGRLPPLPTGSKAKISSFISVPRNVVFLRGEGNDCRSISLFFVHIVLLPEFFEHDLKNPSKQAILSHEFAHGRFTDYLSIIWLWLTCAIISYATFLYIWPYWPYDDFVRNYINHMGSHYSVLMPLLAIVMFAIIDSVGMIHRREINADFGALRAAPNLYIKYLKGRIYFRKHLKFDKFEPGTRIKNWFYHPSFEKRLSILTGQRSIRSISILLPAILAGFCPVYIMLSLVGPVAISLDSSMSIALALSLALSSFVLIQLGIALNEIFGKNSVISFTDKLVFWLGLLIGYQLLALIFLYAANFNNGGELIIKASNGELVIMPLPIVLCAIFCGHILFAGYTKLCALFFGTAFLGVFATPVFAFIFISLFGGMQMTGSVSIVTIISIFGAVLVISVMFLLLLELLTQSIAAFVMRAARFLRIQQE